MLKICEAHHIRQEVPRPLQQLISLVSRQTLKTRFQNNRKGKGPKSRNVRSSVCLPLLPLPPSLTSSPSQVDSGGCDSSLASPIGPLHPSPLDSSPRPLPSSSSSSTTSNGREEVVFPTDVAHSWLCNNTLLCLHDAYQPDNMAAFQHQWRRGRVSSPSQTPLACSPVTNPPQCTTHLPHETRLLRLGC